MTSKYGKEARKARDEKLISQYAAPNKLGEPDEVYGACHISKGIMPRKDLVKLMVDTKVGLIWSGLYANKDIVDKWGVPLALAKDNILKIDQEIIEV